MRVKNDVEVKPVLTNHISDIMISKYGDVTNWPKANIEQRQIKCKNCMEEFNSDEVLESIFEPDMDSRALFICPNCGTHNAIRKIKIDR